MKMLRYLKISIPLFVLMLIGYFLWQGLSLNPRLVPSALINKPVPEFNLASLKNPNRMLSNKLFKGHVSLLNVWATWCATCADEYPALIDIAHSKVVPIYGLDYKDNRLAALKWLKNYGNAFVLNGFDESGLTAINWGVYGTPETFIIDKHGIIRYKQVGEITQQLWKDKLLPIVLKLKQEPA